MSIIMKCKMCGGTLEIKEGSTVAECEYCGTLQTLPKFSDEHISNLYDRANHFRMSGEFDKAEGLYEQILSASPEDAEAYWSLVLCKYGIIYVEDPTSHKRIPTVNRAQYTSIFDDANYKYAIEYADSSQKEIYKAEATAINDIQKGILEISNKEEAFDVFICYKETDENGKRTKDSVLANDIYYQLTQEGLKVFFSKITLEDKLGTAYEPYIFSALNSAKVMVVVGTKPEYFNAVWVKNEWSRYLALIKAGQKKTLIPAYRDMDPYDLPEEFSHLQALDMSKIGFIQDLVRGIKKIVDKKENKKTEAVEVKESKSVNSSVVAHLKRIKLFLEDEEWDKAEEYCEKVLEEDPECGRAYFYRFMAENQYSSTDDINLDYVFEEERDVKKALRFADPELKSQIQAIIYKQNKEEYDYAINCFNAGNYTDAISAFSNIEDFEDSKQQIEKCREKIRENEMWKQYHTAVSQMQNGSYEEALKIFSTIPNFSDVNVKVFQCKEEIKKAEQKKIEDKYSQACTAMQDKDYSGAISIFNEIIHFQDSRAKIEECNQGIKKVEEREKKHKRILLLALLGALLIFAAYYLIGQTYWNKNESGHWHNLQEHEAHSYSFTVVTEATDSQDGSGINTCTVCGYEQPVVIHTFDDGVVTKQQTCTEDGIMTYSCAVCGQELKTECIPASHSYVDFKCSGCGLWTKGPAGGWVFYDCDADNDSGNADGLISSECGWRYLEAAPEDLSGKYVFGYYRTSSSDSNIEVGTLQTLGLGKANTEALVKAMGETAYTSSSGTTKGMYAAKACADYSVTVDGVVYDDWFLPSKNELNLMYTNLHKNGVGSFADDVYWSSSETTGSGVWAQYFYGGLQGNFSRDYSGYCYVRPIRAFSVCSDGISEHKIDAGVITKEPTCTEEGIKTYSCTVCGQVLKTETVAAKGHTSDSGKITKQPTCTEDGSKTYTCIVCGQVIKTERIAARHSYVNYKCIVCGLGSAGGYIFYDCDADNDLGNADGLISTECGWRYLEAAPTDLSYTNSSGTTTKYYPFGYYRTSSSGSNLMVGTKTAIGTGKANTEALIKAMGETTYTSSSGTTKGIYAAKACADYSITVNGVVYDDWFLPSKDELNLMYENLYEKGLGSFANSSYWSSSEGSNNGAWKRYFSSGSQGNNTRSNDYYVRPVRVF